MSEESQTPQRDAIHEDRMARYQSHLEHRKMLHDAYLEVTGRFSKATLTLSGGALVLSMTYVEKLHPQPGGRTLLLLSWITLALSLSVGLASLYLSGKATQTAIKNHDKEYVAREGGTQCVVATIHNGFSEWTDRLGVASLLLFALGFLLLSCFVWNCPPTTL